MKDLLVALYDLFKRKHVTAAALFFLVFGSVLFSNTFFNAWTLDDFPVIVNNPDIRSIAQFWQDACPGRPLREITYLLDYAFFDLNPAGYHIQQIFWHVLNAWLVFLLVCRLGGTRMVAWISSTLFLVHPLHVEVVANVSHRKDSLALAFSLLAILAYTSVFKGDKRKIKGLVWVIIFYVTALFAKQVAVVLPLVGIAYEYAFVPRDKRILFRYPKVAFAVIVAGIAILFIWFGLAGRESYLAAMTAVMAKMNLSFSPESPARYFLVFFKSLTFMFSRWIWPDGLSPEYVFSPPKGWRDAYVVLALVGLIAYVSAIVFTARRQPLAFFALVWMGLFWLPVSNIVPVSYFAADRYLYAPSAGFLIFVATQIESGSLRVMMIKRGALLLLLPCLVWLTWQQNKVWFSHLTLWEHAVRVSPESTTALNNLGSAYMVKGDLDKALIYFKRAAMNFTDPMPYYNMGWIFEQKGDIKNARINYGYFLSYEDPKYVRLSIELRQRFHGRYGIVLR